MITDRLYTAEIRVREKTQQIQNGASAPTAIDGAGACSMWCTCRGHLPPPAVLESVIASIKYL